MSIDPSQAPEGAAGDPSASAESNADQVPQSHVELQDAPTSPALSAVEPTEEAEPTDDAVPADGAARKTSKAKGALSFAKELPVLLVLAFLLALLIKSFLLQAFYIPSASMEPTLMIGDRVLVNKVVYHFHPPRRGDIIVFEDPHGVTVHRNPVSAFVHWITEGLGASQSPDMDFIKRVIGEPGDRIQVRDGAVFVNGTRLAPEPYVSPIRDHSNWGPRIVPAGELFVMGDNRTNSNDSRGTLGFIPIDKVVGRAFVIIWPPSRLHWLSTPSYASP
ncbi:MAG TPA: signal peptidase I [Actinomycetota bacterium]